MKYGNFYFWFKCKSQGYEVTLYTSMLNDVCVHNIYTHVYFHRQVYMHTHVHTYNVNAYINVRDNGGGEKYVIFYSFI